MLNALSMEAKGFSSGREGLKASLLVMEQVKLV
jgi:hypothetical protein